MAVTLTRQISDDEKKIILERFGKVCYATGHTINNESDVQYDHIKAYADKGHRKLIILLQCVGSII